ncbi:hypothetical protein [Streptosporangium longisporum]|uniref:Uncharacterized protein n=1 Tax=Streptosporangium longisporum TaxID=46187 RepID=A0ABN3Y7T1_9ACTN
MPKASPTGMAWAGTAALFVLLMGCATAPKEAAPKETAATATTQQPPPSATPSPTPTTTPPKPFPKAKDGKKLRACRDARCEVLISDGQTITLNPEWNLPPINVAVENGSVSFFGTTLDGTQISMLEQTPDQGGPSKLNDVSFGVVAVRGAKAVIKIAH